jgi:hypothetical protein
MTLRQKDEFDPQSDADALIISHESLRAQVSKP